MSRQIAVAILSGAEDESGPVRVSTLVRTLGALQRVVLQVGEMLAGEQTPGEQAGPTRGRADRAIREACDLRVAALRSGSAEAILSLPPSRPNLFGDEFDLGAQALQTTRELTGELAAGAAWDRVHALLPRDDYRDLILRGYRDLCPTAGEGARASLWDPEVPQERLTLVPATRTHVQVLAAQLGPDDVVEERQLIGKVNLLQDRPPRSTLLLGDGRHLRLPDDDELAGVLWPLWRQRVVLRAICRVVRHADEDDLIVEIKDVSQVLPADESPLSVGAIELPDALLPLREALSIAPDFGGNLVTFAYEPLGIVAYGETREEAEAAFRDELSWLWQEYAAAPDETLSEGAIRLKAHLLALVGGGI